MITARVDINNLNRGIRNGRGFNPPNRFSAKEPKLEKGLDLSLNLKLRKGVILKLDNKEDITIESNSKEDIVLKKGLKLCVGTPNLKKGNVNVISNLNLKRGVVLSLSLNLKRGKDITKKIVKKSKPKKVVNIKDNNLKTDIHYLSDDMKDKSNRIDNSIILNSDKSIRDVVINKDIVIKDEKINIKEEQSGESIKLEKEVKVEDDIVYKQGMSLYEFLKENPKKRTEEIILQYFNAKDLKALVDSGKVLKKRGKLII